MLFTIAFTMSLISAAAQTNPVTKGGVSLAAAAQSDDCRFAACMCASPQVTGLASVAYCFQANYLCGSQKQISSSTSSTILASPQAVTVAPGDAALNAKILALVNDQMNAQAGGAVTNSPGNICRCQLGLPGCVH